MASLPAVFVELKANASQFTAAMHSAQGELKKTADVAATNSDRMAQVGKIAFAGIAAAAIGFGAVAVKAALDGQQAHAQLVQAVTNSGTAFESVGGAVDAMSGRFAKLGFENDNVEAALTRLIQATGNTKLAMSDMGLAADLARARHISLEDAAGALGKVLAGNMKGMVAFGLSAKDASGNALTVAEAVAELNARFGGAAQAQANTYAGRMQALDAQFKNVTESVGNMLLPVLADMAGVVADVVGWFDRHREVAFALAGVIGGPLTVAMTIYIAKQAMAFGSTVAELIANVGKAIFGIVPAAEAAAAAEAGLATSTALATGGLSILGAGVGLLAAHFLSHASAANDVASSTAKAQASVDGMTGSEDGLGGATDGATKRLKDQADLFTQLSGDTNAQSSEIVKLIGDQQSLDRATKTLAGDTTAHAQAQQASTKAIREQADAQTKLTKLTADYNKLQGGLGMEISLDQNHAHHDLEQAQLNHETSQTKLNEAVAKYGQNSVEARQASLDLESATFTLQTAQDSMGTIGKAAWDKVNAAQETMHQAQQDVFDKTTAQKDAFDKLNKPVSDLAANTLAWQQAQNTLNGDWAAFSGLIATHPEIRDQLADTIRRLRDNLPKGADVAPLNAMLDKINSISPDKLAALQAVALGPANVPANAFDYAAWLSTLPANQKTDLVSPTEFADRIKGWGGGRASGGPVDPFGTYLVGEDGPELLRMGSSAGSVSPGGGGVTVVVNVAGSVISERDLIVAVRDGLIRLERQNGGR